MTVKFRHNILYFLRVSRGSMHNSYIKTVNSELTKVPFRSPATSTIVKSYVKHKHLGKVFTIDNIVDKKGLNTSVRAAATKALSRMVKNNELIRVTNGTYYRPKISKFGRLPLETKELIKIVSETKKATIIPAGTAAINALGLDTQLPMVRSYFISERIRSDYKASNIIFKYKESLHYFNKNLKIKDKNKRQTALLFWSAMSYMDQKGVEMYYNKLIEKFNLLLDSETQESFFKALPQSMMWVHKSLQKGGHFE